MRALDLASRLLVLGLLAWPVAGCAGPPEKDPDEAAKELERAVPSEERLEDAELPGGEAPQQEPRSELGSADRDLSGMDVALEALLVVLAAAIVTAILDLVWTLARKRRGRIALAASTGLALLLFLLLR